MEIWLGNFPTIYAGDILKINLLMLISKENPSLHHQFVCKKRQDDLTERIRNRLKWCLSISFSFQKPCQHSNVNCLIQWDICEQWLNVKWCHKVIKWSGSWSKISLQNEKECLRVYPLIVNCFNIATKFFSKVVTAVVLIAF